MNRFYTFRTKAVMLLFFLSFLCLYSSAQNISTIAGVGTSSFSGDGGLAVSAELAQPVSVVRDASGNVYISDQGNHRIRKITYSTGNISTVAGSSTSGYSGDGSSATSAQLYYPSGIAVDGSGNIYIADQGNHRIRKVTASTGVISTIAGTGTAGFSGDGSAATSAKLNNPVAVAVDASGNVYISDQYNQRIRKITASSGNISTIAGTGTYGYSGDGSAATSATFQNPAGIEIDASGNIFIADLFNHVVRKISASTGNISTVAGSGTSGYSGDGAAATSANLNYPTDIAVDDSGNLYISVQYSHRIRKVSVVTGYISTVIGTGSAGYGGDGGLATSAQINYPTGVASDPGGNLYVADRENHRIRFVCTYLVKPSVSSPVNYCVGATASALTATGTSLKWFTTPSGGTGSSTAPTPSTASAGTTKYYVASISPYGCEGPRDSISVVVNALPSAPAVTATISYCIGASASVLTASGTSLLWYTSATGGAGSATAPTPLTSSTGTTYYYVSQTSSTTGCESARALIAVTVNGLPAAPSASTPISYCEGATPSALSASGSGLLWYTTASGGTGTATAITPATTSVGSTTYYVSQTNTCGESARTAITVTVNAKAVKPTVTSPVSYCQYATASALSATGTSLKWYTVATGGTGTTTAIIPSTSSAGTFTYYVSQSNASGCESDRESITVNVSSAPGLPTVTSPVTYCVGATASALSATGSSLKWYTVATGGTSSSSAPTPLTTSAGSTTYYVSQTNASGCEGLRSAIVVTVNPLPAAPTVTSPLNLCEGATASALTASGSGLLWYTTSSGGTGLSTAPTPSTSSVGSTIYYVSSTNSCGESSRTALTVTVNSKPAAPTVTSPISYCQGDTGVSFLSATGTSLKWYTSATGGVGSGTAPKPSTTTAGTFIYYVSQTNAANCESDRAAITVIIKVAPAAPLVTTPAIYCVGATATPLTATGTGLLWYTVPYGGVGSSTAPTPLTTTAGSTTYYVSQTDTSSCPSLRAAITVTVYNTPSAPIVTSTVSYCEGATTSALAASAAATDTLKWYTVATGGTPSLTAPTPSSAVAGSTTYYVSATSRYGCGESSRSSITVTITAKPGVPTVVTPVSYCAGSTSSALSATGTSLKWYSSPSGGTPVTTAPSPSTATAGTFKFYVSQTVSGCESARDSITVTINARPAAPTVSSPVVYCLGAGASALSATGTALKWYTVSSGGTALGSAPTPSTAATGSVTYYVSQTVSGCESPLAAITVNVNAAAGTPSVTSPLSYCMGETATALSASGSGLKWYDDASGGTASTTAPTPSTSSTGTDTFFVSQTSTCGESTRVPIVVNINPKPLAPTVLADTISYCAGEVPAALSATGTTLKWYTVATGGTAATSAPTPSTASAGTTIYYVSQSNTFGCESVRKSITVIVNATPSAPSVTSPVEYCAGSTSVPLTATGTGLKWYSAASGGTGTTAAPTPGTASTGASVYYVSQTSAKGCESARSAINVIVYATPSAPTVGFIVTLCLGGAPASLTATGSGLKWYSTATGGTGSSTAPSPSTATTGAWYYYVSQTSSSGCESPRAAILVNIDTLLSAPTVTSPVIYCMGETASALSASGSALRWYKDSPSGSYTTTAPVPSTAIADTITYYVSKVSSAGCEGFKDSIIVFVNPLPSLPTVSTPVNYCVGATASSLTATGSGLKWYTSATGGTASTTAPVVSTTTAGTTVYYVSQSTASGCEGPRAAITVNVNSLPSSPTVTTPVAYCEGATASALTATGTSLKWYTVATGGTALSGAPTPLTTPAGSVIYYVSQTNTAGCEGTRAAITVNINAVPASPTVVTPVLYCVGETPSALTATGTSLLWYTAATGGSGSTTAPMPSTASGGSTVYYVTQTNTANCESPRAAITVTVNTLPALPTVSTPVNYCVGATASSLTATGSGLKWYTSATGGTASTTAPVVSTATAGTTVYYVSQSTASGCEGPRAAITVNVNSLPSSPTVTTPVAYCEGATASALTATGTSLKWYTVATGGTALSGAPTPLTTPTGSVIYYVSQTNTAGCEGTRAAITVNINAVPASPTVVTPVLYCVGEIPSALTATGTSLLWYTAATGGSGSTTAPTPSTASGGSTIYYVTQTNTANCESPRAAITVTVNTLPALPTVSTPVNYCVGATASSLTATGSGLKWYTSATGGTASTTAPLVSTATAGTTVYYVSQSTASGCEGPRAAITVNVNSLPSSPTVTTPVAYCEGATASALTATGTSLKWYTVATGGTALSGAPTPLTTPTGSVIYYVSQTNTAGCEGTRAAITVTINAMPTAPTVSSVLYCVGETPSALTATGTSLLWYTSATGGSGSTTAPTPSTATTGSTTYYVSQTNTAGCESPRAAITVTVNTLPAAPTVSTPVNYCVGATASSLTATGSGLKWYTAATGGTASTTAPVVSTATAGTTVYYVSQSSALGCEGPRAAITVNINAIPSAPTVSSPVTYCEGASASALTATGTSLKWYAGSTGGTGSTIAPTPSTSTTGSTVYYVSQTNAGGCESARAAITVTVNPLPLAPVVTTPISYCQDEKSVALTATGSSLKWYSSATGGTGSTTAPVPVTGTAGTFSYFVTQSSVATCESPRAEIVVKINPTPLMPVVVSPIGYCLGSVAKALTATGSGLKWYTVASGGTALTSAPVPSTTSIGTSAYYVSQSSSEGCEGPRAMISVEISGKPDVKVSPVGPSMFVYCKNDTVTLKASSSIALSSYQWYKDAVLLPGETSHIYKAFANGNYKVEVKNLYGCSNDTTVYVFGDTLPKPTLSPVELQFCPNVNIVLFSKPTYAGYLYEWFKDGLPIAATKAGELVINKAGDYYVRVTDSFGCVTNTNHSLASTYPAIVKPVIIRLDPVLRLSRTYTKYQWYRNGKIIAGANAMSYTMSFGGKYWCEVGDANGCSELSDTIDTENTSAIRSANTSGKSLKIYPNPTQSKVFIETDLLIDVRVTDVTGRLILTQKDVKEIDLEPFADAVYIFTITNKDGQIIGIEKIDKITR